MVSTSTLPVSHTLYMYTILYTCLFRPVYNVKYKCAFSLRTLEEWLRVNSLYNECVDKHAGADSVELICCWSQTLPWFSKLCSWENQRPEAQRYLIPRPLVIFSVILLLCHGDLWESSGLSWKGPSTVHQTQFRKVLNPCKRHVLVWEILLIIGLQKYAWTAYYDATPS